PQVPMYDPATGVTFDGLERKVVNLNSGAESTLEAQLALLTAAAHPASTRLIPAGGWQVGTGLLDVTLTGPEGRDFGSPPPTTPDGRSAGGSLAVLEPGAVLSYTLPASPAGWRVFLSARTSPAGGKFTASVGRQTLGTLDTQAPGTLRLVMRPAGFAPASASPQTLLVAYDGPGKGNLDAILAMPGLQARTLGAGPLRLEGFKAWTDGPQPLPPLPADASGVKLSVFDAQGQPVAGATSVPPFGFALREYRTATPLAQPAGAAGTAQTVTVKAAATSGKNLFLDLTPAFNGDAFSTPNNPTRGNLDNHDGPKGATFPADRGPQGGSTLATAAGSFLFPPTLLTRNMVTALGQSLSVPAGKYAALQLLATAEQGNVAATLEADYADGTRATLPLTLPDWCQAPRPGDTVGVAYPYRRNSLGSLEATACNLYALNFPLDPGKTLTALRLPNRETLHLFALTLTLP
ncbi:MAG TPA: hypothetical protein VHN99_00575, partial [Deinococcales bacterium]|nr:hypothetical protein [Deinococcales bacterium]